MPAVAPSYVSPPTLAKRYRCAPESIHGFIRAGLLEAIDVAQPGSSRPRYRISPEAIEAFERMRSSKPEPKSPRKRGKYVFSFYGP